MTYRRARALDVYVAEIDAAAPHRSKISDGWIGDAAHASRDSDHNPWTILNGEGIVRAEDITHDPAGGVDCDQLALALAALIAIGGHPALRHGSYVIWEGRIFSFDRRDEGWRPYTGSNSHRHHCHLSVSLDPAGFDSTLPWGVMNQEDPMTPEDFDQIRAIVRDEISKAGDTIKIDVGEKAKWSLATVLKSSLNAVKKAK